MAADMEGVEIREILSAADPAWEGWKEVYLASFPEQERMSEAFFLRFLGRKELGEASQSHMLVMTPEAAAGEVLGLGFYEFSSALATGFLWYLATQPGHRGRGLGAHLYAELVRRLRAERARLLLFEVEIPEVASREGAEAAEFARRRIAWYRRLGAQVLCGVEYFQTVDGPAAPVPMHVMAHRFEPLSVEEVYALAAQFFGDAIQQRQPLTLK